MGHKSKMKMINMAITITLFATSYANPIFNRAEEDESESTGAIAGAVEGISNALNQAKDAYDAAQSVDEGLDAAEDAYNGRLYWFELAPTLTSGKCGEVGSCSECRMSEYKKGLVRACSNPYFRQMRRSRQLLRMPYERV